MLDVDPKCDMLTLSLASHFTKWKVGDVTWVGMRNKKTKKPHGVARYITADGKIAEGTFNDGLFTGLSREIEGFITKVELSKGGVKKAEFSFDPYFNILATHGKQKFFGEMNEASFRRIRGD